MFNSLPKPRLFTWPEVTIKFHAPTTVEIFHIPTQEGFHSSHRDQSFDYNFKWAVRTLDVYLEELDLEKEGKIV